VQYHRYASHDAFVEGLLALTGDPLEPDNGRIVVCRGNPKAKVGNMEGTINTTVVVTDDGCCKCLATADGYWGGTW